jgi:hypothetical protein
VGASSIVLSGIRRLAHAFSAPVAILPAYRRRSIAAELLMRCVRAQRHRLHRLEKTAPNAFSAAAINCAMIVRARSHAAGTLLDGRAERIEQHAHSRRRFTR